MNSRSSVIFVHGLWMPGSESRWFRERLRSKYGLASELFSYRTVAEPLADVTARLRRAIADLGTDQVHVVAHSLGGLVALKMFEQFPQQPPGRVVLLGSPVRGSDVARRLAAIAIGRRMLGNIAQSELLPQRSPSWRHARELGIIAGTRPLGLGRTLMRFQEPNDGTVAVRETELPGTTDRLILPVSHFGMLLSTRVADQTGKFLRDARFSLA